MQQALDFALHLCDLALKHGVHLGANMVPSAQRQKLLDLAQSKPKLLRMTNELEFVNVLVIKDAVSASTARAAFDQTELLIKTDCIHSDARRLRSVPDVDPLCHFIQ